MPLIKEQTIHLHEKDWMKSEQIILQSDKEYKQNTNNLMFSKSKSNVNA